MNNKIIFSLCRMLKRRGASLECIKWLTGVLAVLTLANLVVLIHQAHVGRHNKQLAPLSKVAHILNIGQNNTNLPKAVQHPKENDVTDKSFIDEKYAKLFLQIGSKTYESHRKKLSLQATTSVMFLKTHKTGGSTLQNILFRFAVFNQLEVALPVAHSSFFYPVLDFHSSLVLQDTMTGPCCDIMLHHMVMDLPELGKVMKPSATYLTILRDPVSLFTSAFRYYNLSKCMNGKRLHEVNLNEFIYLNTTICPILRFQIANMQVFDMGIASTHGYEECAVKEFIKQMDQVFGLVLITEMFDESLVVMRHKFNWNMEDITYIKHNVQLNTNESAKPLSMAQIRSIDDFNHADRLLYNHFVEKMKMHLKELWSSGVNVTSEVLKLREVNKAISDLCIEGLATGTNLSYAGLRVFAGYGKSGFYKIKQSRLHDVTCRAMALPELSFDKYLKAINHASRKRPQTKEEMYGRVQGAIQMTSMRRKGKHIPNVCEKKKIGWLWPH